MIDLEAEWSIVHGESLRLLSELPDGVADAVITDPPYSSGGFTRGDRMGSVIAKYVGVGKTHVERADFAGDNRDQRGYLKWCALWLAEALRVTRQGGSLLMFSDWRQLAVTTDAVQAGGWVWRGIVPWDKGGGVRPRRGGFSSQAEYVVWATAGPLRDDYDECLPGWIHALDREKYEAGTLHFTVRQADKHHVTGKPTDLMRELVKIAPAGGLVLDPFAGSGTTGVAALLEGRRFLGVELTAEYSAVARDRLEQAAANRTLFAPAPVHEQGGML